MKATIDDVARASGVSKGTVSRVINGHAAVAPATRERVLNIMNALGYQPDPAARQLSWRTRRSIGLSVPKGQPLLSPYHVLFRRAIERETASLGLAVTDIQENLHDLPRFPNAVLVMHARQHDARLDLLRSRGVPTVVVGHRPGWSWVAADDKDGAAQVARHLTSLGHRDLVYLGAGESQTCRFRQAGFEDAAHAVGARVVVWPSNGTALGAYRATRRAWQAGERPTAVFAGNDEAAVGAITALRDMDARVPQDVSVAGFGDLPEIPGAGEDWTGRLTTVAQNVEGVASQALELIREALDGKNPRGVRVPVHLVRGETTAPPGT